jgi:hypothetical protein
MSDAVFVLCLAALAAIPIALLRRPGPPPGRLAAVLAVTALVVWGALHARFHLGWGIPAVPASEAFASVEVVMEQGHLRWVLPYLAAVCPLTGFAYAGLCLLVAQVLPARRAPTSGPPA